MSKSATDNDRGEVFTYLMNCRAMVKVSTSAVVGGVVSHDYVVIHEAPPRVVGEIITNFRMVHLRPDGLLIPLSPDNP